MWFILTENPVNMYTYWSVSKYVYLLRTIYIYCISIHTLTYIHYHLNCMHLNHSTLVVKNKFKKKLIWDHRWKCHRWMSENLPQIGLLNVSSVNASFCLFSSLIFWLHRWTNNFTWDLVTVKWFRWSFRCHIFV